MVPLGQGPATLLVIGYGNTLRQDDGVGVRVAEALMTLELPGVTTLTCHQLLPELAELVSQAAGVVFVDASAPPIAETELRPIQPDKTGRILAHVADPPSLLALSTQLFGRAPPAWSLGIPVSDFGFGEHLSPRAQAGLRAALALIKSLASQPSTRLRLAIRGAVQGVGFRPFIYRLASELGLNGWVNNSAEGVFVEVEAPRARLQEFLLRLEQERPPRSFIQSLESSWLDPTGCQGFEIRPSEPAGAKTALVLPDIATCPDCLREVFDPNNRRYRYPFTNCTNCGPRFSIIESLPYDRANTSMRAFAMCPLCQAEYDDPRDRRFHAQPNACPVCGPRLELWTATGECIETGNEALLAAAEAIRRGQIVAAKGLSGFHLMAAAHDEAAVCQLRLRKRREEKPFALMFPSLASVREICDVSPLEQRLLLSPESPIVLLRRKRESDPPLAHDSVSPFTFHVSRFTSDVSRFTFHVPRISPHVAPSNPHLGVLLPYTPLHHLLMAELGFPIVATSGNLSDEPICIDEREALARLRGIADLFLVHNRRIVRHVDDSIARVVLDREMVLRRARGYAPLPVRVRTAQRPARTVLAVGGHLKNSVALAVGNQVFLSQHIGDLETEHAFDAFRRVIGDFQQLYDSRPQLIAADLHPDYLSTKFARDLAAPPAVGPGSPLPGERGRGEGEFSGRVHGEGRGEISPSTFPHCAPEPFAAQALAGSPLLGERGRGEGEFSGRVHGEGAGLCYRRDTPAPPELVLVQHHIAHVLSCMAENELAPPALGVSWDGAGYGLDGAIWGGEFFGVTDRGIERVAHLRPFRLPGGDTAVKEPRRAALGLLYEMFADTAFDRQDLAPLKAFSREELAVLRSMLSRGINAPVCCSIGRLFDAVASLINLRQQIRFEGQAAMELEFLLNDAQTDEHYPLPLVGAQARTLSATPGAGARTSLSAATSDSVACPGNGATTSAAASLCDRESSCVERADQPLPCPLLLDWSPLIESILGDLRLAVPAPFISAKFHNALTESIVAVAKQAALERVVLSGGCFQNRYLTERAARRLSQEGFRPYWHQRVPPNDGGLALGQIVAALNPTLNLNLSLNLKPMAHPSHVPRHPRKN